MTRITRIEGVQDSRRLGNLLCRGEGTRENAGHLILDMMCTGRETLSDMKEVASDSGRLMEGGLCVEGIEV